jgi:hypothetical protein
VVGCLKGGLSNSDSVRNWEAWRRINRCRMELQGGGCKCSLNLDERSPNMDEHSLNMDECSLNMDKCSLNMDEHSLNMDE